MKKLLLTAAAMSLLLANQNTQNEALNALKASPFYNQIEAAKKQGLKIKADKIDGLYVYKLQSPRGPIYIYITADKKYTFIGNAIDNKTKKPIHLPKNANIINEGVMFTFGKGKKEIYLVTDPECPFCRKMEAQKKEILAKNYKVHVILLPLPFHRYAKPMSYYILAAKTDAERAKRMKEVLSGSNKWKNFHPTKEQIAKFNKELQKARRAASELEAQGTPSVYDKNFNPIPWPALGEKK